MRHGAAAGSVPAACPIEGVLSVLIGYSGTIALGLTCKMLVSGGMTIQFPS